MSFREFAEEILQAADKYQINRLKLQCELCIAKKIKVDNVCRCLKMADRYSALILRSRALAYFQEHRTEVLESESWDVMESEEPFLAAATLREILTTERKAEKRSSPSTGSDSNGASQKRARFV